MNITGIYFSGTGNTKWVAEHFMDKMILKGHECTLYSIEETNIDTCFAFFEKADIVGFFYPIYGCDMPEIVENYIKKLSKYKLASDKKAFTITSAAMYSGDAATITSKYFDSIGIELKWAINVLMPCNFDTPFPGFKIPNKDKIAIIKTKAEKKIILIIDAILSNRRKIEGSDIFNKITGISQRLSSKGMTQKFSVKVNPILCIGCGKCVKLCPTKNLYLPEEQGAVETKQNCTVCLRCINNCPTYSIRLFSTKTKKAFKQYKGLE